MNPTRRGNIVGEVLKTEQTYVRELMMLVELYVGPLEMGDVVTMTDVNLMFANIRSILLFHQKHLLPELEEAAQNPDQPLGAVFLRCAPFFKMYSQYYNNFDVANQFITQLEQSASSTSSTSSTSSLRPLSMLPSSSPPAGSSNALLLNSSIGPNVSNATRRAVARRLKHFMKQVKANPAHSQISLQAYLILPVQRLPRYKLLVDQLLDSTPLRHPDRKDLEFAAEAVRARVAECNDNKKLQEEAERGLSVMSKVKVRAGISVNEELFCHVRSGRRLVREGVVRVLKVVEAKDPALRGVNAVARVDAGFAVGGYSKRERFYQNALGPLIETRFVDGASTATTSPPVGVVDSAPGGVADALSVYGLQRTSGKEFSLLLFSDVLCWCRVEEEERELIRAFGVGGGACSVEMMVVLSPMGEVEVPVSSRGRFRASVFHGNGQRSGSVPPTRLGGGAEAVMRVSDGSCVMFVRGPVEEIEGWVEAIKGLYVR
ncbi:Dbl homology domain-containing protein [Chytridium lagenaria]|nr:Dbl homology domain-containing protein [Chytridium lagenaria]